ncbi:MAG: hypothetical protein JWQ30_1440 [Sediminibacterium sp.]|nr:hypothetical protein [Sediminibacterium sp.]
MVGVKKFLSVIFLLVCSFVCYAQVDSTAKAETTRIQRAPIIPDSPQPIKKRIIDSSQNGYADSVLRSRHAKEARLLRDSLLADSTRKAALKAIPVIVYDTSSYKKYATHPYLPLHAEPVFMVIDYHKQASKDDLFYLIAGIVLVLALIRAGFSKYFRNLFVSFFQTSIRQKQTRDQLLQDNLASLLTNFLFVISAGLYLTLLVRYKNLSDIPFWGLAAGSAGVLLLVYLVKYLFLLFTGWVFNNKEAAGSYVFVVFLVNKVMGVLLIPFLLIFAFAGPELVQVSVTLSIGLIVLLLGYRYWVSFVAIRSKLKVNALHFLLYLCAVELLPLALIYKIMMSYFNGSL